MTSEHIPHYAKDCAACDCVPTHKFHGIPCIAVTRTVDYVNPATDRCDGCGKGWPAVEYRDERIDVPHRGAA